jgi:hypothetical protein
MFGKYRRRVLSIIIDLLLFPARFAGKKEKDYSETRK